MSYEAWRITFQDSEQAAKAAYEEAQRWERMFTMAINSVVELTEAAGIRKEDQLTGGTVQALTAIENLKQRREKWKVRALEAEQGVREMVAKAASHHLEGYRELGRKAAAAEEERDAMAAYQADLIRELTACQAVLHSLAHDGQVTPAYANEAKEILKRAPKISLAQHDALIISEFIEQHAENLGACTRNYADKLAQDLRLQANGCTQ